MCPRARPLLILPALVILSTTRANAIPSECSNDAIRAISPSFAQVCDTAYQLKDSIENYRNRLSNIQANLDSINGRLASINKKLGSVYNRRRELEKTAGIFAEAVRDQASRLKDVTVTKDFLLTEHRKLVESQNSILSLPMPLLKSIDARIDLLHAQDAAVQVSIKKILDLAEHLGLNTSAEIARFESGFELTSNLKMGTLWFETKLPGGMRIDTAQLESLAVGIISAPSFDPVEVALKEAPLSKQVSADWNSWSAQEAGYDLFSYISSKRFTDFFGSDNLGAETLSALLSGGVTASGSVEKARKQLLLEWSDVLSYASNVGRAEIQSQAGQMFKVFFEDSSFSKTSNDLKVKAVSVPYKYDLAIDLSNMSPIMREMAKVSGVTPKNILSYDVPHLGFTINLGIANNADVAFLKDKLRKQAGTVEDPLPSFVAALQNAGLGSEQLNWIKAGTAADLGRSSSSATSLNSFITYVLGDKQIDLLEALKSSKDEEYVVDLRGSKVEQKFREQLRKLAVGGGDVHFSSLSLDLRSSSLSVSGTVEHRISVRSLADVASRAQGLEKELRSRIDQRINSWSAVKAAGLPGASSDMPLNSKQKEKFLELKEAREAIEGLKVEIANAKSRADEANLRFNRLKDALEKNRASLGKIKDAIASSISTAKSLLSDFNSIKSEWYDLYSEYKSLIPALNTKINS